MMLKDIGQIQRNRYLHIFSHTWNPNLINMCLSVFQCACVCMYVCIDVCMCACVCMCVMKVERGLRGKEKIFREWRGWEKVEVMKIYCTEAAENRWCIRMGNENTYD